MNIRKPAIAAASAAVVLIGLMPMLRADTWNKRTQVTLTEPIIAGNKVLEPGTYIWKLMDSPADRHIVRIYNQDETKLETTVLAIPDYRLRTPSKSQFAFWETPNGVPKAVRAWFYPGDNSGQEFPYPKKLIAQLASVRPTPIPQAYTPPAPVEPVAAPKPAAEPVPAQPTEIASAREPAPQATTTPAPEPAAAPEPHNLPTTASNGPLVGLLGLFSLSFFGVMSLATKRS